MNIIPSELIKNKKWGGEHSPDEIRWLINAFTSGELPEYQMSAWAMAVWFKGMTDEETAVLTEAMRDSGDKFNFSKLKAPRIDKHSTGGVGDKTSLIIGPIMAAAKVFTPMIAGRGLGHTGGTLDKLESIPGFRIHLTQKEFEGHVEKHHFALMGQTKNICPADRKFYALRDVTSTVDSLPLICGSIMSKKLAEDLTGLVLDVKFGSGAFMKTLSDAERLATLLKSTGEKNGLRVSALITNMNEPLGRFIGNSVEVRECLDILEGKTCFDQDLDFYSPTRELSLELSGYMLWLAGRASNAEQGRSMAEKLLASGEALAAFHQLLEYQGPADITQLPQARHHTLVQAPRSGYISSMNTEQIGLAGISLRAGRKAADDIIDYASGIEVLCRLGMPVKAGQNLFRLFSNHESDFDESKNILLHATAITDAPPPAPQPLIAKILN